MKLAVDLLGKVQNVLWLLAPDEAPDGAQYVAAGRILRSQLRERILEALSLVALEHAIEGVHQAQKQQSR
jgi:hypothetical protein